MSSQQTQLQQQSQNQQLQSTFEYVKRHRKLIGISLLYILGLYAAFFATGLPISDEGINNFEKKMTQVERLHSSTEWRVNMQQLENLDFQLYNAKVWFWWFRPEARQKVNLLQQQYNQVERQVRELVREEQQIAREARGFLGLWSHQGVKDSKALFWQAFDQGKIFARRQTMWDAIFNILNSREEDWMVRLVQLVLMAIVNFSTGMLLSLLLYLWRLPGLIWSYNAGWVSGVFFVSISFLGAAAVVASFLIALYGTGAVFVYAAAKNIESRGRLGPGSQRRQRINYQHRHYD
eukprot:TRINITY_DN22465_c0_g1_i10.p1 TRINITY_DN22465_c0_g1~~TRINITY_DN22465_c0_g1_i10.p1  ORF type:complete len:292 (-),score=26.52 TRINITY_DN22465_c0_g1_i10:389-1264(-)